MKTNTNTKTMITTRTSDTELIQTRVFDAPRKLVFQVYTDAETIPQWWGPRYLTTVVEKMEVKPGGTWRFIQRSPDGKEYAFRGEYREVVTPEKIVYTFEFEGMPGHIIVETVTFEETNGKTTVRVMSVFQSREDLNGMLDSGMEQGAIETWDRFAELLETLQDQAVK
jgi:uncharacterized protein YndB with AHSA1/START domain